MKIAVTYDNEEIFQHFGHTENFKIYDIENDEIINSEIISSNGQGHGALSEVLKSNGVDILICGGIGGGARIALDNAGIELYPGASGNADEAVKNFINGTLEYNPNTMCNHHGEGHQCGSHSCH